MVQEEPGAGDSDATDYLQDPALWEDRLPQPYRMIEHLLEDLLDAVWERIESLQACKEREAARVRVPEGTGGSVWWCGDVLSQQDPPRAGVCAGSRSVVFVGDGANLLVLGYEDGPGAGETPTSCKTLAQHDLSQEIAGLAVRQKDEVQIVLTQHDSGTHTYFDY